MKQPENKVTKERLRADLVDKSTGAARALVQKPHLTDMDRLIFGYQFAAISVAAEVAFDDIYWRSLDQDLRTWITCRLKLFGYAFNNTTNSWQSKFKSMLN